MRFSASCRLLCPFSSPSLRRSQLRGSPLKGNLQYKLRYERLKFFPLSVLRRCLRLAKSLGGILATDMRKTFIDFLLILCFPYLSLQIQGDCLSDDFFGGETAFPLLDRPQGGRHLDARAFLRLSPSSHDEDGYDFVAGRAQTAARLRSRGLLRRRMGRLHHGPLRLLDSHLYRTIRVAVSAHQSGASLDQKEASANAFVGKVDE